ncbi:NifB/NifX family molybdenum-iron cluster-binding protein [Mangrovibacter yixingensis]|uniref:NifB/NifX family molybdenum-iron cluster-binding protein n=1 Tax=Mangrovibacter yixingensis TaxID=1529639 RepID=UPI001CFA1364|nr:NifB/NifX family molybdenum-iron cluster-binding protein [Mangrovibacter yixingensis]
MTIAIPRLKGQLSPHFTKADSFALYTDKGEMLDEFVNPAFAECTCEAKRALFTTLQNKQVTCIVVRNIGQHMLGKLLDAGMRVLQAATRDITATLALLATDNAQVLQLTAAEQGRPSLHHGEHHGQCEHAQGQHGEGHACCHGTPTQATHAPINITGIAPTCCCGGHHHHD